MTAARLTFPRAFANREPDMISKAATDRGDVFTVRNGDVSQAALVARLPDAASEPLRKGVAALSACMDTLAEHANLARSEVHPARFPDRARELVAKNVSPAFQALTQAGITDRRDAAAAWSRVTTPDPAVGTVRQEYRQLWTPLSFAERAARVENADIEELAAITEAPGMFSDMKGTPIWDEIERRSAILNVAKKYSLNGAFSKQPTAAEPLASGPDNAQVDAEAQRLIDGHKQRIENLSLVETTLRSVVTAIAAATEQPIEDAYRQLMGRE